MAHTAHSQISPSRSTSLEGPADDALREAAVAQRVIRGDWISPHPEAWRVSLERDMILLFDADGLILKLMTPNEWETIWPTLPSPSVTRPGCWWTPGFIDTHVHYPQTQIIGSASGPLLDWLSTSVFPEEARFAERGYASAIATRFCEAMLRQGTTSAAIFSSSHVSATEILFQELAQRGVGAELGLTLMDRGAPADVLCPAEEALEGCERLIERWHLSEGGRLRFCMTPRFGLSCTPELLRGAGLLAAQHQLLMQTHISENPAELVATAEAFPNSRDYLGVYEDFGLINERSLLAHCIWLSDSEWSRVASADVAVSHCPDSNFFLGSGSMSLSQARERGVRVGLGSDVGAGRSFSILRACARAYDASRITQSPVTPAELFWLASRGGALALRRPNLGVLSHGAHADVVCLEPPPLHGDGHEWIDPASEHSINTLISQIIFSEDWSAPREVYTRGVSRWTYDGGLR